MARIINNYLQNIGDGTIQMEAIAHDTATNIAYFRGQDYGFYLRDDGDVVEFAEITHFGNTEQVGTAADGGNGYILEFKYTGTASYNVPARTLLIAYDDGGDEIFSLQMPAQTIPPTGDIELWDSTNINVANAITVGAFGSSSIQVTATFAIYFEYSSSGAIVITKDGVEVCNETGVDLGGASTGPHKYHFETIGGRSDESINFGPFMVMLSGCTSVSDRLSGDGTALPVTGYAQSSNPTATPNFSPAIDPFDEGSGIGYAMQLTDGAFNDLALKRAVYLTSGAGADKCDSAPKVDWPGATDTILAAKYTVFGYRGGGGGTSQHILYGNAVDGYTQSLDLNITSAMLCQSITTEDTGIMPEYDEDPVIGFQTIGAQDWDVHAMAMSVLYLPGGDASPAPPPLLSLPGKAMRHMIIR